jgi:hypothetical protein
MSTTSKVNDTLEIARILASKSRASVSVLALGFISMILKSNK